MEETRETIEGLEKIRKACFESSLLTGVSIESRQINIPEVISKSIQCLKALEQAEGELDDEEYLSDKIYATTQYLPLSDKEVAILNGRLAHVISTTKPILAKALLRIKELEKELKEVKENV